MAPSSILIYNPRAGRWRTERLVRSLQEILARGGLRVEARATERSGHATSLAREAAEEGAETVIAFGGDGTLREAAAGLLGSETSLGMIPGGTANVVTLSLGLPPHPLVAAKRLERSRVLEIDVGLCGGAPFLMSASAGLDARILTRIRPRLKRLLGRGAFVGTSLRHWWTYSYPEIELIADGRPLRGTFAAVCNLPHYGGKWRLAPQASFTDRQLDLVLFAGRGRAATLGFVWDLVRGRHLERHDVDLLVVEEVEIRGPRGLTLQVDGDALPIELPATVRLAAERLRVLAPE